MYKAFRASEGTLQVFRSNSALDIMNEFRSGDLLFDGDKEISPRSMNESAEMEIADDMCDQYMSGM